MSPSPSAEATAKDAQDDKSSVEQALVSKDAAMAKAKAENENESDEENSDSVPETRSSSESAKKPSLNQSRTGASAATSLTAASSGVPGAFRVAPSFTRSSSNSNSNSNETNENSHDVTITTTETTNADVEAPVASPVTENPEVTTAYLVHDELAEVEPIKPFYQRKEGRRTISLVAFLLVVMAVLLVVFLTQASQWNQNELEESPFPTLSPTQAPTFDPRPTLEVVQDRGVVICGIEDVVEGDAKFVQYNTDFCRGLAAVIFGDPEKFNSFPVGGDDRYVKLLGREVDVLLAGDTLTLEKAIKEVTTDSGLAFGFPYYGAAVVFAGPATYVQCANDQKRYDECQDLKICAVNTPELLSLLPQYFPASFIRFGPFSQMEEYLKDGTCNVIASDTYRLSGSSLQKFIDSGVLVISDFYISRNLISSVVRYGDSEWYDIVEGSRLSSFRASQIGLYQNTTACNEITEQSSLIEKSEATNIVSSYNSPICVGNSVQTFQRSIGETVISFGSFISAIDAPTLGSLECSDCADVLNSGKLKAIKERGQLNCAVYLDPVHNLTRSSLATLVNEKFCQLLGVVIFQGNPGATNITYISEMDYTDFPSEYDVITGAGWENKMGNAWDLTNAGSMTLSYPYFIHDKYRNEGKIYDGIGIHLCYAIDNKDESLALLTTAIVVATVYAQRQGITKATHSDMPLIHLFGDSLTFMLRDVIAHAGNYDEIINEAFANSDGTTEIGWNTVIPNYSVAAKMPVLYCDYTGNCPPCMEIFVAGYPVCVSVGPY